MGGKRFIIWLILVLSLVSSNKGHCQELHTPYPVIFVHGLVGDERGWNDISEWLPSIGLVNGGTMHFCLNQDGNNSTSTGDYKDYTNIDNLHKITKADFYTINFDVDNYGTPHDIDLLSNQAAIVKQGVAVKDAIRHVLDITGKDKVILVGHSMGGLAIREFIRSHYSNNVAKIVTIGTPHYGSDLAVNLPISIMGIDTKSDAVRDLNPNSIFLFGGEESSVSDYYYNKDVNCNGSTTNHVIGLNEYYENLNLVARTYIVSRYSKILGNGDGVVEVSSQYINPADTIMTDRVHIGENGEQKDIYSIIRGLDEPEVKELAYEINETSSNKGFITYQRYNASLDMDLYKIIPSQKGTLTLGLSCINTIAQFGLFDENLNVIQTKNNITTGQISALVENKTYYIRIIGEASNGTYPTCWNPYTLSSSLEKDSGTPTLNASPSSLAFGDVTINETSTKNFSISGSDLTDNVSVSISGTGFTISKSETSGFSTSSLSFSPSGGTLAGQKVYVRFSPTSTGSKTGSISVTSSGANTKTVSLSGTGVSGGSVPSNDNPCSPQSLAIKTSCSYEPFTTINASSNSDIPFTGASLPYQTGRYDDDVWFSITPTFSAPISIKIAPTSNLSKFDVSVGLYQGNCSNPTQIQIGQGVAGGAGAAETINFTSQANTTYLIRVFSYDIGSSYSGNFDICVTSSSGGDCDITFLDGDDPADVIYSNSEHSESLTIEGQPNCNFTVSESCSWFTVTPMSGTIQSNGQAFLDFSFEINNSTNQRQCTFYINDEPVTVTQDGEEINDDCIYSISPSSQKFSYQGGSGSFTINATAHSGCDWDISLSSSSEYDIANFTSITNGTGPYTITYTIDPNPTTHSLSSIYTITGNDGYSENYEITQDANSTCNPLANPTTSEFDSNGGSGLFNVEVGQDCYWNVYNSCGSMLTNISPKDGYGPATITYDVLPNYDSSPRDCKITIQQSLSSHKITQKGVCITPAVPASATGTETGQTSADLSWAAGTPVGSPTVTYYWVVGTSASVTYGNGIAQGTSTETSASATGLSPETTYYLRVYAKTSCNESVSLYATSAAFTTTSSTPCTTPGSPVSLSTSGITSTSANLSWAAGTPVGSPIVTYYWVVGTSASVTYGNGVAQGNSTGTSASATGLSPGTTYYFRVSAMTNCNNSFSEYGTSSTFTTTSSTPCTAPGTPVSLTTSGITSTSANLSWAAGTPVESPIVTYYWVVGTSASVTYGNGVAQGNSTGTSASATGLSPGTTYYFRVLALTTCNNTFSEYGTSSAFTTTTRASDYCDAGSNATTNEFISNFAMGSINQASGRGVSGYEDFTSQITNVERGENILAVVTITNIWGSDQVLIWVDWNKDGDFTDIGENTYSSTGELTDPQINANFTVPFGAMIGTTRLRVRLHDALTGPNTTPCGMSDYGEIEDYTINIIEECVTPPVPETFIASIGNPANGLKHYITTSISNVLNAEGYSWDFSWDGTEWTINHAQDNLTSINWDLSDNPNNAIYWRVRSYDCNPKQYSDYIYATPQPIYTACDDPAFPTVNGATSNSINVTLNAETPTENPSITTYSIYCTTKSKYVQSNGTLGNQEVFQTKAAWGTITVTGLIESTQYCFYAKARNVDGDIRFNSSNYTCESTDSQCIAPISPTGASASQTTITAGQSTTLQQVGGVLNAATEWVWYTGGCGGSFVGNGATLSVSPTTTTTYYVQASACGTTTTCRSVTITVTPICIAPTSPTGASASQTTITAGQSTTLQQVGGVLNSATDWLWYSGSCGGNFVDTGATLSVSPTTTTTYYVQATACNTTTTCRSVTITVTDPPPSKSNNPSPSNGATNQPITVDLSWSNGGGATSYKIYFGTVPSPEESEYKVSTSLTSYDPSELSYSALYYWRIDAINSGGITSGDIWQFTTQPAPELPNLKPYKQTSWDYPIVPSSIKQTNKVNYLSADTLTYVDWAIINNSSVNISHEFYTALYLDNERQFAWKIESLASNAVFSIEDYELRINNAGGMHNLKIITDINNDINESNDDDNVWSMDFYWSGVGITENIISQKVKIFPNPTADILNVEINSSYNEILVFEIYDVYGGMHKRFEEKIPSTNYKIVIDCSKFNSGIYFLKIISKKEIYSEKFSVIN